MMKNGGIDRRRFLQALGAFALAGAGSVQARQGRTHLELSPAQPTLAGKIEVIEFFHYGCPHCRDLDPLVERWKKTLSEDVAFHRSPVIWGQGALAGLARLYFSLDATGQLEALHSKIFAAVQDERRLVYDRDGARAWVQENGGDGKAVYDAWTSFGVETRVKEADARARAYKIDGVPTLAVGGRYLTSASLTGSHEAALKEVDRLIAQLRRG